MSAVSDLSSQSDITSALDALSEALVIPINDTQAAAIRARLESEPFANLTAEELHQAIRPVNSGIMRARAERYKNTSSPQRWNPKEIIKCDICGSKFKRGNKSAHEKTKMHQRLAGVQSQFLRVLWHPPPMLDYSACDNIDSTTEEEELGLLPEEAQYQ